MSQSKKVIIYYDQQCTFCKRSVQLLVKYGRVSHAQIVPAQKDPMVYELMQIHNSWVVVNGTHEKFVTFQAGVEVAKYSPILKWLVPLAKPRFMQKIGEWVYRKIANNRSRITLQ